MKMCYFNDEKNKITVKVLDTQGDAYYTLEPARMGVYEVDMPEDSVPFIKKWMGMVMLSYTKSDNLDALKSIHGSNNASS